MVLDRNKVLLWFFAIFTLVGIAISIIIVFENLLPSMKTGKTFINSNCEVLDHYIDEQLIEKNQICLDLNNDIWWYNTLGENDFYSYVVRRENHHNDTNSESLSSDSQYPNHTNNSDSSSNSNNSSDSYNSSSMNSSGDYDKKKCYVGLYLVTYTTNDNIQIETNISGVWNSNEQWVQNYLNVFFINETYHCYYQSTNNNNANWFASAKFSIAAVAIIGVCGGFTFISFLLTIVFFIRYRNIRNHYIRIITPTNHTGGSGTHHHHHQSSYQGSFPN